MAIEYDLSVFESIGKEVKEEEEARSSATPLSWIPDGEHTLRFFLDPDSKVFRSLFTHKIGDYKGVCLNYLRDKLKDSTVPSCAICEEASKEGAPWQIARRERVLTYGVVYESTAPDSQSWTANKPMVFMQGPRLRRALQTFINSLYKDAPEFLQSMFNPQVSGGYCRVRVVGGPQGQITMTAVPAKLKPPIAIDTWYKPLSRVWFADAFDQSNYQELIEALGEFISGRKDKTGSQTSFEATLPVTPSVANPTSEAVSTKKEPTIVKANGKDLILPDKVVERGCWTKFNKSDPECMSCPVNIDCVGI